MTDIIIPLLFTVKFWLLLILSIPATVCSITIFVYFYRKKQGIHHHHHLILVLVTISFLQITTDILFSMLYYRHGTVISPTAGFCTWWNWWEYSLGTSLLYTMAWGSIERHFLIFGSAFLATRRRRIVFHFFPGLIAVAYPVIFYLAVIVFNSCANQWDYNMVLVSFQCVKYLYDAFFLISIGFMSGPVLYDRSTQRACL